VLEWLEHLDEEDLAFVRRFILASGSLKELAQVYGISYPTVRLRLDRLIEKIKAVEAVAQRSPFERALRAEYASGKIDQPTLKRLLAAYQREQEEEAPHGTPRTKHR
jgi:hypothetical protein